MHRRNHTSTRLVLLAVVLVTLLAAALPVFLRAQGGNSLRWGNVSAGYGISRGGGFTVAGTGGEVDAGRLSGDGVRITGGFWGPVEEPPPWLPPIVQYRLYLPSLHDK